MHSAECIRQRTDEELIVLLSRVLRCLPSPAGPPLNLNFRKSCSPTPTQSYYHALERQIYAGEEGSPNESADLRTLK